MYFEYGRKETEYLKNRDKKLGEVIDKVGHIYREVDSDIFSSIVRQIASQQISMKASESLLKRIDDKLGTITPEKLIKTGREGIKSFGMTYRKADYILELSEKVQNGEFNVKTLLNMNDAEAERELVSLKGVGIWTAEMILIFSLKRPDILSYGDLGILRGMRMVYNLKKIDKRDFEIIGNRLSPYRTVASLYFWEASGGAVPGLRDPAD